MRELSPCPHCGGDAYVTSTPQIRRPWDRLGMDALGYAAVCTRCGVSTPSFIDKAKAIECWNRRPHG